MKEFDLTECRCHLCSDGQTNDTPQDFRYQEDPTPYAVSCKKDGLVYMSHHEYVRQISNPDSLWCCPICDASARWNDDNYEEALEEHPELDGEEGD